jgi:PAS domain-containing protein
LSAAIFLTLVPAEYRDNVESAFAALTPQKPLIIYEHYNRGRLFRWKNRAVFNEEGDLKEYFTVGEDITEYRAAEANLRESEARNRALVNALPDLIFRYSKDGYYIDAVVKDEKRLTEAGRRLHREGRLIGSNLKDVLSPAMVKLVEKGIARVLKSDELQVMEYSYIVRGKVRHHEARMVKSGPEEVMSIVRDITDRKNIEESLHYQLDFEKLVAHISSAFVNAPAGDLNSPILYALKRSGQFFGADRSCVFRFSEDGQYMSIIHEWCAPGISSQIERNQNLPVANTPWWMDQLLKNDYVLVPDVEALPPEAHKDRDDFRIEEIKSLLTLPLIREGLIVGFFGFDAVLEKRTWSEKQISLLTIIAEIIAGALSKHDAEEKLKESEERYREILATIEEGYYEADLQGRITYCNDAACKLIGGYRREELMGLSYEQLYANPDEAYKTFHQVFVNQVNLKRD